MRVRSLLSIAALGITACRIAEVPEATPGATGLTKLPGTAEAGVPNACTVTAISPSEAQAMPKCACASGGQARCVPNARVPSTLVPHLETCGDGSGACVPEAIAAAPTAPLPVCQTRGAAGRCLDLCVPLVAKNASLLDRGEGESCAASERCVPCTNPLDGTTTGVCSVDLAAAASGGCGTPDAGPAVGPSGGKTCCHLGKTPRGRCVAKGSVPGGQEERFTTRECSGTDLCVPNEIGSESAPRACAGGLGICVGSCIELGVTERLLLDSCGEEEVCVPCFAPFTGLPTGLPGCR
jgi:hypothetical protein